MNFVKLNNGVEMPQMGLGTFQSADAALCEQTILDALEMGYRLIDTAQDYGKEARLAYCAFRMTAWSLTPFRRSQISNANPAASLNALISLRL